MDGLSPLIWAIKMNQIKIVKLLIQHNYININLQTTRIGNTALTLSVYKGYTDIINLLLERKDINLNLQTYKTKETALMIAMRKETEEKKENKKKKYINIINKLLKKSDIDFNLTDLKGNSVLSYVIQNKNKNILEYLLDKKIQISSTDAINLLFWASRNGYINIVMSLIKRHNVSINTQDEQGNTPLIIATQNNHYSFVFRLET